jgi:hypothetical protein
MTNAPKMVLNLLVVNSLDWGLTTFPSFDLWLDVLWLLIILANLATENWYWALNYSLAFSIAAPIRQTPKVQNGFHMYTEKVNFLKFYNLWIHPWSCLTSRRNGLKLVDILIGVLFEITHKDSKLPYDCLSPSVWCREFHSGNEIYLFLKPKRFCKTQCFIPL